VVGPPLEYFDCIREVVSMDNQEHSRKSSLQSFMGCFVRIGWFLFGPGAALFILIYIMQQEPVFSWVDGLFLLTVLICLVSRGIDILLLEGETACGEPATRTHLVVYLVRMSVLAVLAWGVAHGVSYLMMR